MEREIIVRQFKNDGRKLDLWIKIFAWYILFSFMVNFIVGTFADGNPFAMFEYGGPYWAGFGNMMFGLFMVIILFIIKISSFYVKTYTLTNKRLILSCNKKLFLTGLVKYESSYMLDKINSYEFVKAARYAGYSLSFKTATGLPISLVVDKEFYDEFVKAINDSSKE